MQARPGGCSPSIGTRCAVETACWGCGGIGDGLEASRRVIHPRLPVGPAAFRLSGVGPARVDVIPETAAATGGQTMAETTPRYPYWPITRRPPLEWPNGARVAFWIGLNVEYFEPGKRGTAHSQATTHLNPDAMNFGWREYGPRVGVWRIRDMLDKYGMRASVLL